MNTGVAVIILVILLTDNWTAACLFGSSADCVFRCHCANNAACNVTTGQCPGLCEAGLPQPSDDVTRYDWRGPACQIGNVALNKSAEQSGVWGGLVAGNAVDGILGDGGNDNCAHPDAGSGSPAWWRVDLGAIHAIHNVTVFNTHDAGGAMRMNQFEIGVGNTTNVTEHTRCASYASEPVMLGGDVTLICNSPLYGRYVSFRRTGGNQPHLVTICEFVVMGYKQTNAACGNCVNDGCDDDILGCMDSAPCRYTNGTCTDGCHQWYVGDKCDLLIGSRGLFNDGNITTVTVINSTSIEVQWKSKEDIPDSLVSYYGYVVKYGLSGSDNKATSNDVPHQATQSHHFITISGLQPATTYDFQVFIYRKQNSNQQVGSYGAPKVTATTRGNETAFTTQVTTETSPSTTATATTTATTFTTTPLTTTTTTPTTATTTPTTATTTPTTTPTTPATTTTPPTTTTTTPTTATTTPTTTTTTPTTMPTTQTTTTTSQAPPSSSSTPDLTTSTLSGPQDPDKRNDQHKTIVALGVINALQMTVIIVGLLVFLLYRRRVSQQSKTGTASAAGDLSHKDDYENVAISSSPDALTASDHARSAGRACQNNTTIGSINETDHSGKEQPYETLSNYMEVKAEYSSLNIKHTN